MGQGESIETYRAAERRLKLLLLGDGSYEAGVVRGEETRERVRAQLRRLRVAFDDVAVLAESEAERILDLEAELKAQATAARRKTQTRARARRKA